MASLSNRVISIYNRKTSMRLAPAEWEAIDTICRRENIKRKKLFELIDANKDEKMGLTSSVRLFSLIYYRKSFLSQMTSDASRSSPIFEAIKGIFSLFPTTISPAFQYTIYGHIYYKILCSACLARLKQYRLGNITFRKGFIF